MSKHEIYRTTVLSESYWPASTNKKLLNSTLSRALRDTAAEVPDRIALVEGIADAPRRRTWTYAQLLAESERIAQALLMRFKPGERIAIWAPNIIEWVLLQYGCHFAGLVIVTVNPAYRARELEYVLNQSQAAGLFLVNEYRGHDMTAAVQGIRDNLPALRELIDFRDFEAFVDSTGQPMQPLPEVSPNDPCFIMYTSGTTGVPKGALLHNTGILNTSLFSTERAGLEIGGVYINPIPMFHIPSCGVAVVGSVMRRATHVLVAEFDPALVLDLIETKRGTYVLLVPTMLEAILAYPDRKKFDLSSLRHVMSGAAMVEAPLVRRTRSELGCSITIVYGQTETHAVVTSTHMEDSETDQSETVGQPIEHCEVKIADPTTGQVLALGVEGEICMRGHKVMLGYFRMEATTRDTIKADGWLHTGDMGSMDERGFVKITGRLKDMIIRGGENIYPREIENLLQEHPKISRAAVVGVPDSYWGEQVAAVVQPRSAGDIPTAAELHDYCRANLTHFKTPKFWYVAEELPWTQTGKLQKFKLREWIAQGAMKALAAN